MHVKPIMQNLSHSHSTFRFLSAATFIRYIVAMSPLVNVLFVVALIGVIVTGDVLFFRTKFVARLVFNVSTAVIFCWATYCSHR